MFDRVGDSTNSRHTVARRRLALSLHSPPSRAGLPRSVSSEFENSKFEGMHPIDCLHECQAGAAAVSWFQLRLFFFRRAVVSRREKAEQAVRLIANASGEEKPVAGTSGIAIAELQPP